MTKRVFALLMAVAMVFSILPTNVFARPNRPGGSGGSGGTGTVYGENLGWEYANITENTDSSGNLTGYDLEDPTGNSDDYSDKVTVTYTIDGVTSDWSEGSFTDGILSSDSSATVHIECDYGFFISYIVLCCDHNSDPEDPFGCQTVGTEDAYGLATADSIPTSVTLNVADLYTKSNHASGADTYFLMVMLERIPDDVFVGYDVGEINGMPLTSDPVDTTQTITDAEGWVFDYPTLEYLQGEAGYVDHAALAISDEAVQEAAAKGYAFAGWELVYYHSYQSSNNSFSSVLGTGNGYYQEGDAVSLYTHALLTAVWQPLLTISVSKQWDDANDQDGIRPEGVDVQLKTDDGTVVETVTLDASNGWTYEWILPQYDVNNQLISYSVQEVAIDGYTPGYSTTTEENRTIVEITNTHSTLKTTVSVLKRWDDSDNQDGLRPDSVTVQLYADGVAYGDSVELNADNNWLHNWTDLPQRTNGQDIVYTVEELTVPDGYEGSVSQDPDVANLLIVTNTHQPAETQITVNKVWEDADNQDGLRPDSVTVELYADMEATGITAELNQANGWTHTFTGLAANAGGKAVVYSVKEVTAVDGYTSATTGDAFNGFTITNTHIPETTSVDVSKVWDDANNQDGIRPTEVTVNLYADDQLADTVILNAQNNWKHSFIDLAKYADGAEIVYTVEEAPVTGYTASYTGDAANGFTITNTHTTEKTEISVVKIWNDSDNQDGKRPASVTVHLLANGVHTGETRELNASNDWSATWTDLEKFSGGTAIVYTVSEVAVDGYTTVYGQDANGRFTIANFYSTQETTLTVQKVWEDNDDQDGIRPDSVTVEVYADGVATGISIVLSESNQWKYTFTGLPIYKDGVEIEYSVQETNVPEGYTASVTEDSFGLAYIITNTHTPETIDVPVNKVWNDENDHDGMRPDSITVELFADGEATGKTLVLSAANDWEGIFQAVAKYSFGTEVIYTVEEKEVPAGYTVSYSGTTITNTHIVELISIPVSKVWEDGNNQDGLRPVELTIDLYADGVYHSSLVMNADNLGKITFQDLPKYADGQLITYTVQERDVPAGYTALVSGSVEDGFAITNTHEVEKTEIRVTKVWDDADNQDGKRPASVTVELHAAAMDGIKTLVLSEENNWTGTWTDLDVYASGTKINYTVYEQTVDGYTTTYTRDENDDNHVIVTNSYTPATTYINVEKVWDDANNQDGIRPGSVTVELYANGQPTGQTAVLNDDNHWEHTFADLAVYANGQEIIYTAQEQATAAGYTVSYAWDAATRFYEIINTHEPQQTEVFVSKVWDDDSDRDGLRPDSITVEIYEDGIPSGITAELNAANGWKNTFTNLPLNSNGTPVLYDVRETAVPTGYTVSYTGNKEDGFVITNSHTPEKTELTVSKLWEDNHNQDGIRPTDITVNLYANGAKVETVTLNAEGNWKHTFQDLYKYADGAEIVYTVDELDIDGYTGSYDGLTITNTHTPETTVITATKVWDDNDNKAGQRPAQVIVHLVVGTETIREATLSQANNWTVEWEDLPVYHGGTKINYTIYEEPVEDYTPAYSASGNDFTVTNTYTPAKTSLTVKKVWVDNDNQDGIRPDSVTVQLLINGQPSGITLVLNQDNHWTGTFLDLDENLEYAVAEQTVAGYEAPQFSVDPETKILSIINTHVPETVDVPVNKIWADNNNQDGLRPDSVTVELFADGEATGKTLVLSAANNWEGTFQDVAKYSYGTEVIYTVEETEVPAGYTVSYNGTTITNTHTPETIDISANKVWVDSNNQDGLRPVELVIDLYADGEYHSSLTMNAGNLGMITFEDLPKYANGELIAYTVQERDVPAGYIAAISGSMESGYTITNTHEVEKTEISVSKVWDDKDNQDGKRPESVIVHLLINSEFAEKTVTLSAENNWTAEWTDLDVYAAGTKINYTVYEEYVDGYTTAYTRDENDDNHVIITNAYTPSATAITVQKVWEDNANQDGLRPDSVTVELYANGQATGQTVELNAANHWKYTFTGLDKFAAGEEIEYSVVETTEIDGYEASYRWDAASHIYEIVNTHEPEKTEVSASKVWEDNNNQDGLRPSSVTVELYADGVPSGITAELSEKNDWAYTFTDLPLNSFGTPVVYSVQEVNTPKGYEASYAGNQDDGFVITNVHTPELSDLYVSKIWDDENNQDGIRPGEIVVTLYANSVEVDTVIISALDNWHYTFYDLPVYENGEKITYAVYEERVDGYLVFYSGLTITNVHLPETTVVSATKVWNDNDNQDGKRPSQVVVHLLANGHHTDLKRILNDDNDWTARWHDLPMYSGGVKINYTVYEEVVDGYTTTYARDEKDANHVIITNTYSPEKTSLTVLKVWEDGDNQDALRPNSVTVELYADGKPTGVTAVLGDENNWQYVFADLQKMADGKAIAYTAVELDIADGYTVRYQQDDHTGIYEIINTHILGTTQLTVNKVWNDANDQDGIRPESIIVSLFADGEATGKEVVLSAANNWTYTFTDLPAYSFGTKVIYTVEEKAARAIIGYTAEVIDNGDGSFTIINTHIPDKTQVSVNKVWNDNHNQDGKRPGSVTVELLANGVATGKTLVLNDQNNWTGIFAALDVSKEGDIIHYTVVEKDIPTGYASIVSGNISDGFTITNTYSVELTQITVNKVWDDLSDKAGLRPDSITVHLLANGEHTGLKQILNAENGWTYTWTNLEAYHGGALVNYTVWEAPVDGYHASYERNGNVITLTNTHNVEEISVSVQKIWQDENDNDGLRAGQITVELYANGEPTGLTVVLSESNGWIAAWTDLPRHHYGELITYTVQELDSPAGYTASYEQTVLEDGSIHWIVTNLHTLEKTNVSAQKVWQDENDRDGFRPDQITVELYANGKATGMTAVLSESNGWTVSWTGLAAYQDGEQIAYEVLELDTIAGYTASYEKTVLDDGSVQWIVTNVYTREESPETGDSSFMGIALMMFTSMLGLAVVTILGKKKNIF